MAEIKNKWSYQFDPLNPKNVEITENGVAVFLTQSLTNAQRLCGILNNYPAMYEALKEITELAPRDKLNLPYAIQVVEIADKAIAKVNSNA